MGLSQAGFEVVGVDIEAQPRYPFEFHCGDALEWDLGGFDLIWASPPCQAFSVATRYHRGRSGDHPDLVTPMRKRLRGVRTPWVIENVPGAPLLYPIMLCGTMFGLKVYRHRYFETWPWIPTPNGHPKHPERPAEVGRPVPEHGYMTVAGHFSDVKAASRAMGIDWMTRGELAQAVPPAYAKYIAQQMLEACDAVPEV